MSLETLLEAARFVEQQELRAKQFQNHLQTQQTLNNNHQINRSPPFKIVSSVVAPLAVTHTQITQTPPAALVAVPQVPNLVQPSHSLVAGASIQPNHVVQPPRPPGALHQVQSTPVMLSTQTGVVEVIQKPLPPTITVQPQQIQTITNGFDKATALLLEDNPQQQHHHQQHQQQQHPPSGDIKKRHHQNNGGATTGGMMRSGTREVHNKLEKNRRAHLKECFELLKKQLPQQQDEKKTSNLSILHSALRYIQGLRKKERENEHEMERLARDKIASQQRLAALKKDLGPQWDNIDLTLIQGPEQPPLLAIATPNPTSSNTLKINPIKDEDADEATGGTRVRNIVTNGAAVGASSAATTTVISTTNTTTTIQPTQLSAVPMLPLPQVGYPVSQGLVLGVQKVALVSSKNLPLVSSPIAHIIPQLNGKVVPLVNAQYLMKPVVVVSTPNQGNATITPRPS